MHLVHSSVDAAPAHQRRARTARGQPNGTVPFHAANNTHGCGEGENKEEKMGGCCKTANSSNRSRLFKGSCFKGKYESESQQQAQRLFTSYMVSKRDQMEAGGGEEEGQREGGGRRQAQTTSATATAFPKEGGPTKEGSCDEEKGQQHQPTGSRSSQEETSPDGSDHYKLPARGV